MKHPCPKCEGTKTNFLGKPCDCKPAPLTASSPKLEEEFDVAINEATARVHERFAAKYLDHFRAVVAQFKTYRHEIEIVAGMGTACIQIDGELLEKKRQQISRSPVYQALDDIEHELRGADWSYMLDEEKLN